MKNSFLSPWLWVGCLLVLTVGCGQKPPETIEAGGQVLLNGIPLASAEVRFIPLHPGLDANYMSTGVTDQNGRFQLTMLSGQSGVCVCRHQVLVMEGPLPEEARGMSDNAQTIAIRYMESLKNRPIPGSYGDAVRSPLKLEVVSDQNDYKIELSR
jgi:hypothetical protein